MTPAPAGPVWIPGPVSAQLASASITEFAYLTPRGEPLCWPVTPYWYPDRGVLAVATGLAYPNKAYYSRRHPRVSALFGDVLVQGDAVVLDEDLQANTDRYVREMRAKFIAARLGLNSLSVRLLDFYLPRLWIEITPVRLVIRRASGETETLGAPAVPGDAAAPDGTFGPVPLSDPPGLSALRQWVRRHGRAVVALAGADGYPAVARTGVASGPDGSVDLDEAPGLGPAVLTFHSQGLGGMRLDALMARGRVVRSGGSLRFVPRRVVGFLGREPDARPSFLSIFPLSQLPRAAAFRNTLRSELARRGEAPPRLRVPR